MWYIGESRYAYATVTATSGDFTISSCTYVIYNCSTEEAVASGTGSIITHTVYALFTPTAAGKYVCIFSYVIGEETLEARQVVEVRETM